MSSVFCPLHALDLKKATFYLKKEVRCSMDDAQVETYTGPKECRQLGSRHEQSALIGVSAI